MRITWISSELCHVIKTTKTGIMKRMITYTMALLIVFSASVATAADSAYMATNCQIFSEEAKLYRLIYQAPYEEKVTIQIYDDREKVVYEERLATSGFNKRYDLTNLPDGEYLIEVKSDGYFFSEELNVGDLAKFSFTFDQKENRKVTIIGAKEQGKQLTLYILGDGQDVLYKEQFDTENQIHKKYNFEKMRGDNVTFLLYHNDRLVKEEQFVF